MAFVTFYLYKNPSLLENQVPTQVCTKYAVIQNHHIHFAVAMLHSSSCQYRITRPECCLRCSMLRYRPFVDVPLAATS